MSQFLEAVMLLCFGLSWPLSLVKNLRARSTRTMSLGFILLITAGYIAGITAKLISGTVNYVLAVYLFNLVVVGANIAVYFRNLRCDRLRNRVSVQSSDDAVPQQSVSAQSTHPGIQKQEILYRELNTMTSKGSIVFFGSGRFSTLPFTELAQSFGLGEPVCNRSIGDACIDEAAQMLRTCVLDLHPSKVFVCFGEAEAQQDDLNIEDFIAKYEWLLYTIRANCHSDIYVVSLLSDTTAAREINRRLQALAHEHGNGYIDITSALRVDCPELHAFSLLQYYIHSHPLDFAAAMNVVNA